jgi:predicted transcriptional regulator
MGVTGFLGLVMQETHLALGWRETAVTQVILEVQVVQVLQLLHFPRPSRAVMQVMQVILVIQAREDLGVPVPMAVMEVRPGTLDTVVRLTKDKVSVAQQEIRDQDLVEEVLVVTEALGRPLISRPLTLAQEVQEVQAEQGEQAKQEAQVIQVIQVMQVEEVLQPHIIA